MSILGASGRLQTDFFQGIKKERLGQFWGTNLDVRAYSNVAQDVEKIATLTLATSSGNQVVTIAGVAITTAFDTDDAATAAAVAANINATYAASTQASPGNGIAIASRVSATAAAGVVTITGKFKGDDFPLSYSGTGGTLVQDGTGASQVAANSSRIEFGLWVGANTSDLSEWISSNLPCRLPNSANTKIWGVGGGSSIQSYSNQEVLGVDRGQLLSVVRSGTVVVQLDSPELTVVSGDDVYPKMSD